MPSSYLSSSSLNRALKRLAALAATEHLVLELALCHGRVFSVVYNSTDSKVAEGRMVESSTRAATLVRMVATEQRLPAHWLENDVKYFLAFFAARNRTDFDLYGPSLLISLFEPRHILAMKLHVCQVSPPPTTDFGDVDFLIGKMGLVSLDAVEHVYKQFFIGGKLEPTLRLNVGDLLASRNGIFGSLR